MPTRAQVVALRDGGLSFDDVARQLGISPGLAEMIATGRSSQLSDPPIYNPTARESVHHWILQRAQSDGPMQEAAARRDPRPGDVNDPDDHDLLTVLTRQHNQVTALLKQLVALPLPGDGASPAQVEDRLTIIALVRDALTRHAHAESLHLWPTVRGVRGGDEVAARADALQRETHRTLAALVESRPAEPGHGDLVEQLVSLSRHHVALADKVFLVLAQDVDEDERRRLGEQVLQSYEREGSSR